VHGRKDTTHFEPFGGSPSIYTNYNKIPRSGDVMFQFVYGFADPTTQIRQFEGMNFFQQYDGSKWQEQDLSKRPGNLYTLDPLLGTPSLSPAVYLNAIGKSSDGKQSVFFPLSKSEIRLDPHLANFVVDRDQLSSDDGSEDDVDSAGQTSKPFDRLRRRLESNTHSDL